MFGDLVQPPLERSRARCRVISIWVSEDEYALLELGAERTLKHPDRLARDLLMDTLHQAKLTGILD